MKKIRLAAALAGVLLLTSCSIKTTNVEKRTVSVTGSGSVEVEADNATIILSVITRGKDVALAAKENAEKMSKVQENIISLGITKENVTTERYNVEQETIYNHNTGRTSYGDYTVTNKIKVFVKDLSLTGNVIDTALKSGANQLSSFQYGISNKDSYVKQARTLAVQNAHDAANLIATTSGAMLGKVQKINERTNSFALYKVASARASANDAMEEAASVPTPISAGKTTISFTVDVVYELK